jgi:hypothetical protein
MNAEVARRPIESMASVIEGDEERRAVRAFQHPHAAL